MDITIIGAGYVGLVTGVCFSSVGNNVYCVDIDEQKINMLNKGVPPIYEDKLSEILKKSQSEKRISFTTKPQNAIHSSKIIFLAVSTPMNQDGSSKLDYILDAARDIGKFIDDYKVIVVKSTVPVGTTYLIEDIIKKEINKRGKNITFDIVNNPEFLKEGMAVNDFMRPDRIILGINNDSVKDLFRELYRPFSMNHEKLFFLDIPSSELTKYAANAMLAMKISFINEISQFCEKVGANINYVREGIGSDSRIGYSFIYPSIGFGGSCFPKDLSSLKNQFEKVGLKSLMSNATLEINNLQRRGFTSRIIKYFKNNHNLNKKVSVWGITFKPGTDDIRESQAIKIVNELIDNNFHVKIFDPEGMSNAKEYFSNYKNIEFINEKYEVLHESSALLLLTEWAEFRSPDFRKIKKLMNGSVIFDGRNIYDNSKMQEEGFTYFQIGVSDA